jgi:hypothetical protein
MRTQGIEILLDKRGHEQVTFKDVADHLADYVDKFPREKDTVDNVAKWLAGVEDLDHDHEARDVGSDAPEKT